METLLLQLPGDPVANTAAIGVVVLAVTDFILGSLRALGNGTFVLDSFSTWVRTSLAGHVLPIIFLLIVGQAFGTITIGTFSINAVLLGAEVAAASFAATVGGSILATLNPRAIDTPPSEALG